MPITREEKLLNTLATGVASGVSPITREEQYLSYIAGETVTKPDAPITRKEAFLDKIPQGGGGGGGVTIRNQNKTITENGTYTADSGYTGLGTVTVDVQGGFDISAIGADIYIIYGGKLMTLFEFADLAFPQFGITKTNSRIAVVDAIPNYLNFFSTANLFCVVRDSGEAYAYMNGRFTSFSAFTQMPSKGWIEKDALYALDATNSANNGCYVVQTVSYPLLDGTIQSFNFYGKFFKDYIFDQCELLRDVNCPNLLELPTHSFSCCRSLSNLSIPKVEKVGILAFSYCRQLKDVYLPSANYFSSGAFSECTSLATVRLGALEPPVAIGDMFPNCTALQKIIVPVGCADAYKAATNWSAYADIIVEEGATE